MKLVLVMGVCFKVNVAAINTIASNSNGAASKECQYNLCLTAEKPALSKLEMNSGRSQNERVSGGAKLLCILLSVISVANQYSTL